MGFEPSTSRANKLDTLKHYSGLQGAVLGFLGMAVKVTDESAHSTYYLKLKDVAKLLDPSVDTLPKDIQKLLSCRILEIANPDSRTPASARKLDSLFRTYQSKNSSTKPLDRIEEAKIELSEIPELFYKKSMNEIVAHLKPGDFLVRKYHEDNDNPICTLQHLFRREGYREAFKCSHIAVYLGKIDQDHWIAEASMPHGHEPQIRRIRLDDPRFDCRPKNQYLIIRNRNGAEAEELVKRAVQYSIKLIPKEERTAIPDDLAAGFRYNYLEAARSMWHSEKLGYFGRQRLFKYYADHKNGIPFEYMGKERRFFCSHFALMMESLAEMNTSRPFADFMKDHPLPRVYNQKKTGAGLKVSKLWYSIRKGVWARWMSFRYRKKILKSLPTHLDALRTSPQNAVNYMMDHKDKFAVVGIINRKQ